MFFFSFCSRIDVRSKPLSEAEHLSTGFGSRAYFRTTVQEPAVLALDDVKRHDAGVYRCRVDFHRGQSRSVRYNLTVIGKQKLFYISVLKVVKYAT